MTTLPQTTTIRLPRPAAPQQLAYPAQGMPMGPMAPVAATGMTPADIWRVIRSNLWLIILALLLAGAAGVGAYMYLRDNMPRYTASALLRIEQIGMLDPLEDRNAVADNIATSVHQRTQAQLLKSEDLLSRLFTEESNAFIRETNWFKSFNGDVNAAKRDIRENMGVSPIPDTTLISVSMSAADPRDSVTLVNLVIDQHLKDQNKLQRQRFEEKFQDIDRFYSSNADRLRTTQDLLRKIVADLALDGMGTSGRLGQKELELTQLVGKQLEVKVDYEGAMSMVENTKSMMSRGIDPPYVEQSITQDPTLAMLRSRLIDLQVTIASMNLAADHPRVLEQQRFVQSIQTQIDERIATVRSTATSAYLEMVEGQAAQSKRTFEAIAQRMTEINNDLAKLTNDMNRYLTLRDQETALNELVKVAEQRRDFVQRAQERSDMRGVSRATFPQTPEVPSFPRLSVTLAMALFVGLALSLGIAFLREMMDTSVRSPRDIARIGQMNFLGMLPSEDDDPQTSGAPLPLVIYHAPHSMMAEQFRQVRTRLQHSASLDTTRSILITSPSPGDGKTTVACNLATGLALNGRRILLVDANFRRPEIHKVFQVTNDIGFSNALQSPENFDSAIIDTQVPNLSIMPTGPKPANGTELLESQLFLDFIERSLEEFDHVIFDSGPLLFVSESVAMAPRVDGVVTVVKARSNSRGVLQRLRDALKQIKAEHLGVILNAVRSQAGGYYNRNIKTYYAYQNDQN